VTRKNRASPANSLFIEPKDNTGVWKVGTSGWSYPPNTGSGTWTGIFYPLKRVDELKFYSQYFNTVEINSTFYRPCTAKTAESWVHRTPDDFEFTLKAWQLFTHAKENWTDADIQEFKAGIVPLIESKKLGCVLFQFPTSFHRDPTTEEKLRALLSHFGDVPKAVELRHRSWNERLDILQSLGAAAVFIDEPKFKDSIRQDFASLGPTLYVRFHGRRAETWWRHEHRDERYDYLYTPEEIQPYSIRLKEAAADKAIEKAYIFFNNHPGAKAVANAVMMRAQLDVEVKAELPETLTTRYNL
jgi:uncharacterized protein YecE (DUF72 family)